MASTDRIAIRLDRRQVLILPHPEWQAVHAEWIAGSAGGEYGAVFAGIPTVVIDNEGNLLRDDAGIWA